MDGQKILGTKQANVLQLLDIAEVQTFVLALL